MQTDCSTSTDRRHCALARVKGLAAERLFNSRQRCCTRWNATVGSEGKKQRYLQWYDLFNSPTGAAYPSFPATLAKSLTFSYTATFAPEPCINDLAQRMTA